MVVGALWAAVVAAMGNPPFEAVPGEAPGLALVSRSYRESDDSRVWAAGGFVLGDVQSIELSVGGLARRVAIGPHPTGFVAVIAEVVDDDGDADPDMDLVVVRAFDSAGDLVDDSSRWSKPDLADGTLTLAEALLQPAGSVVTVEGVRWHWSGSYPDCAMTSTVLRARRRRSARRSNCQTEPKQRRVTSRCNEF